MKNHATNWRGCHGQDQPFILSFWFIVTVDEALDEVAVPSAPWTGVIVRNLYKGIGLVCSNDRSLNTNFSAQNKKLENYKTCNKGLNYFPLWLTRKSKINACNRLQKLSFPRWMNQIPYRHCQQWLFAEKVWTRKNEPNCRHGDQ